MDWMEVLFRSHLRRRHHIQLGGRRPGTLAVDIQHNIIEPAGHVDFTGGRSRRSSGASWPVAVAVFDAVPGVPSAVVKGLAPGLHMSFPSIFFITKSHSMGGTDLRARPSTTILKAPHLPSRFAIQIPIVQERIHHQVVVELVD